MITVEKSGDLLPEKTGPEVHRNGLEHEVEEIAAAVLSAFFFR